MAKYLLFVAALQILNFSSVWGACVPWSDCPVAVKYIAKRRNDPETITILRNANCGWAESGTNSGAGLYCERIPDFVDVPEGCVNLSDCPQALELINTRRNEPGATQLLRSAACGYNGKKNMIMCNQIPARSLTPITNMNLLPSQNECGLQVPTSKITFGEIAELEDFPWLALFKYKNQSGFIQYRCHGSLISSRYVVTAAHCVSYSSAVKKKYGSLHKIVLGEYDITKTRDCLLEEYGGSCALPVQEFSPESIHIHPKFGSDNAVSDIALIRLSGTASFSDFVKPICLPTSPLVLKPNEAMWISGWGKTEERPRSDIKLKAKIHYITKATCVQYNVDDTQMCAGSNTGADTCQGDSGGPLMAQKVFDDNEVRYVLAGVVSFGNKCGAGAAIYTDVTPFVSWILKNMRK